MKKLLFALALNFSILQLTAQIYHCYDSDLKPNLKISVKIVNNKAVSIKYKGQKSAVPIIFQKEIFDKGGAYSTITEIYLEKYNGNITGKYIFTKSGNWRYIEYQSKAGKVFNFTIDNALTVKNQDYRVTPCY